MGETPHISPEGISRREALKRGLKLTGAVIWATPVVQAVGMRPALAQTVSPSADSCCVKVNADGTCDGINPNNTCYDPPVPASNPSCCDNVESVVDSGTCVTITLVDGCSFVSGSIRLFAGSECDADPPVTFNGPSQATICNDSIRNQQGALQNVGFVEFCMECND